MNIEKWIRKWIEEKHESECWSTYYRLNIKGKYIVVRMSDHNLPAGWKACRDHHVDFDVVIKKTRIDEDSCDPYTAIREIYKIAGEKEPAFVSKYFEKINLAIEAQKKIDEKIREIRISGKNNLGKAKEIALKSDNQEIKRILDLLERPEIKGQARSKLNRKLRNLTGVSHE